MTHFDMSLPAGATLQNQKYIIQKLLHQSDSGVTYQAKHAYLGQTVILQTLNASLQQRSDFGQLRQQFLDRVRAMAQSSESPVRVLDCFEEDSLPFVVFESSQALLQLADGLLPAVPGSTPGSTSVPSPATVHQVKTSEPLLTDPLVANVTVPVSNGSARPAAAAETLPPAPPKAVPYEVAANQLAATSNGSINGFANGSAKLPSPKLTSAATQVMFQAAQPRRSKAWMPVALILMSTLGGLLGVGFGLSVRFSSATATAEKQDGQSPKLTPRLFSREQSFPSDSEWPVSETPQIYSSDPLPVEEPVYRTSPLIDNYTPPQVQPIQPLPTEAKTQPVQPLPSTQPSIDAVKTLIKPGEQPDLPDFPSPSTNSDAALTPPAAKVDAPAAPVEPPAPAPAAEVPAPAAIPDLPPLPELSAPPAPTLPTGKSSVIKQ